MNVLGAPIPDLELPAQAVAVRGGEAVAATLRAAGQPRRPRAAHRSPRRAAPRA